MRKEEGAADTSSLVVDLGTATTKSGWSLNGPEPDLVLPSVVGRGRHDGAMATLGLKNTYVGEHARILQGILSLRSPFQRGCVQHWDDLESLWQYVWEQETGFCSTDNLNPADQHVLVSVPPLCSAKDWRRLAEMLLEGYGLGGVYLANKSVLSMYGGGRTTGICVDSGEDMTYIVPCWEGSPLPNATMIMKLGGKHVTDRLMAQLSYGKYSFPDDTFLLWKRPSNKNRAGRAKTGNGRKFCVVSRRDIVQEAKERFCRFSPRPTSAKDANCKIGDEEVLKLPDGNMLVVGSEASSAPEIMFQPDLAKNKSGAGLHELVYESLMRCDEKYRGRLLSNVVLTGGNTMMAGLDVRLQKELERLLPAEMTDNHPVRVHAQNGRDNFTWIGGSHLTSLASFQRLWLTKQDYLETGSPMNVQEATVYEQK